MCRTTEVKMSVTTAGNLLNENGFFNYPLTQDSNSNRVAKRTGSVTKRNNRDGRSKTPLVDNLILQPQIVANFDPSTKAIIRRKVADCLKEEIQRAKAFVERDITRCRSYFNYTGKEIHLGPTRDSQVEKIDPLSNDYLDQLDETLRKKGLVEDYNAVNEIRETDCRRIRKRKTKKRKSNFSKTRFNIFDKKRTVKSINAEKPNKRLVSKNCLKDKRSFGMGGNKDFSVEPGTASKSQQHYEPNLICLGKSLDCRQYVTTDPAEPQENLLYDFDIQKSKSCIKSLASMLIEKPDRNIEILSRNEDDVTSGAHCYQSRYLTGGIDLHKTVSPTSYLHMKFNTSDTIKSYNECHLTSRGTKISECSYELPARDDSNVDERKRSAQLKEYGTPRHPESFNSDETKHFLSCYLSDGPVEPRGKVGLKPTHAKAATQSLSHEALDKSFHFTDLEKRPPSLDEMKQDPDKEFDNMYQHYMPSHAKENDEFSTMFSMNKEIPVNTRQTKQGGDFLFNNTPSRELTVKQRKDLFPETSSEKKSFSLKYSTWNSTESRGGSKEDIDIDYGNLFDYETTPRPCPHSYNPENDTFQFGNRVKFKDFTTGCSYQNTENGNTYHCSRDLKNDDRARQSYYSFRHSPSQDTECDEEQTNLRHAHTSLSLDEQKEKCTTLDMVDLDNLSYSFDTVDSPTSLSAKCKRFQSDYLTRNYYNIFSKHSYQDYFNNTRNNTRKGTNTPVTDDSGNKRIVNGSESNNSKKSIASKKPIPCSEYIRDSVAGLRQNKPICTHHKPNEIPSPIHNQNAVKSNRSPDITSPIVNQTKILNDDKLRRPPENIDTRSDLIDNTGASSDYSRSSLKDTDDEISPRKNKSSLAGNTDNEIPTANNRKVTSSTCGAREELSDHNYPLGMLGNNFNKKCQKNVRPGRETIENTVQQSQRINSRCLHKDEATPKNFTITQSGLPLQIQCFDETAHRQLNAEKPDLGRALTLLETFSHIKPVVAETKYQQLIAHELTRKTWFSDDDSSTWTTASVVYNANKKSPGVEEVNTITLKENGKGDAIRGKECEVKRCEPDEASLDVTNNVQSDLTDKNNETYLYNDWGFNCMVTKHNREGEAKCSQTRKCVVSGKRIAHNDNAKCWQTSADTSLTYTQYARQSLSLRTKQSQGHECVLGKQDCEINVNRLQDCIRVTSNDITKNSRHIKRQSITLERQSSTLITENVAFARTSSPKRSATKVGNESKSRCNNPVKKNPTFGTHNDLKCIQEDKQKLPQKCLGRGLSSDRMLQSRSKHLSFAISKNFSTRTKYAKTVLKSNYLSSSNKLNLTARTNIRTDVLHRNDKKLTTLGVPNKNAKSHNTIDKFIEKKDIVVIDLQDETLIGMPVTVKTYSNKSAIPVNIETYETKLSSPKFTVQTQKSPCVGEKLNLVSDQLLLNTKEVNIKQSRVSRCHRPSTGMHKVNKVCDDLNNNNNLMEASHFYFDDICHECSSNNKSRPSLKLLGELAFQLERRILDYVFGMEDSKRRRFYGYTVSNIFSMMEKESKGPKGGSDVITKSELAGRLKKLLTALEKYGYNIKVHGEFAQEMVNKYGLLACPPDESTIDQFGLNDASSIGCLIQTLAQGPSEISNLNILLNCLKYLSKCDKRPLFMW